MLTRGMPGCTILGAVPVGQLKLVQARGPGLTEAAIRIWQRDPSPIHAIKVEGKCKQWFPPA